MSNNKNPLSEKKQSMLAELESIKSLLDDELDNIPVLQEAVIEEDGIVTIEPLQSLSDLAALSDNVQPELVKDPYEESTKTSTEDNPPNVLPGQQALFNEPETTKGTDEASKAEVSGKQTGLKNSGISSDNPFLPEHIRHRLNGSSGFVPEEPLIISPQKLSSQASVPPKKQASAEKEPRKEPQAQSTISQQQDSEQIVDRLVAQYLPKIESDLRKELHEKLSSMVDLEQKTSQE